jgi:hypothetical protein
MAVIFPASPTNGDRVILAGVGAEYQFINPRWKKYRSSVTDSGFSDTVITLEELTVDGGDADGI